MIIIMILWTMHI